MAEPFAAFPSWFPRIARDRCGKDPMVNEVRAPWRDRNFTKGEVTRRGGVIPVRR